MDHCHELQRVGSETSSSSLEGEDTPRSTTAAAATNENITPPPQQHEQQQDPTSVLGSRRKPSSRPSLMFGSRRPSAFAGISAAGVISHQHQGSVMMGDGIGGATNVNTLARKWCVPNMVDCSPPFANAAMASAAESDVGYTGEGRSRVDDAYAWKKEGARTVLPEARRGVATRSTSPRLKAHVPMSERMERNKRSRRRRHKRDPLPIAPQDRLVASTADASGVFSTAAVALMAPVKSCSDRRTGSPGSSRAASLSSSTGRAENSNGGYHSDQRKARTTAQDPQPEIEHETNGRGVRRSPRGQRIRSSSLTNHDDHGHGHHRQTLTSSSRSCAVCNEDFTTLSRAHKCRLCRLAVCISCSIARIFVPGFAKRQRVCRECVRHPSADASSAPWASDPGDSVATTAMPRVAITSAKATGFDIRVGSGVVLPRPHASEAAIKQMDMARTASVLARGQRVRGAISDEDGAFDVVGHIGGGHDDGDGFGGASCGTGVMKKSHVDGTACVVIKARAPDVVARVPKTWQSPLAKERPVVTVVPACSDEEVEVLGGKEEAGSRGVESTPKGEGLWEHMSDGSGGRGGDSALVLMAAIPTASMDDSGRECLSPVYARGDRATGVVLVSSTSRPLNGDDGDGTQACLVGEYGRNLHAEEGDAEEGYRSLQDRRITEDVVETISATSPCGARGSDSVEAKTTPREARKVEDEVGSSVDSDACPQVALQVGVSAPAIQAPEDLTPAVSAAVVECEGLGEEGRSMEEVAAVVVPTIGCPDPEDETNRLRECEPNESGDDNHAPEDVKHDSVHEVGCLPTENDGGIGQSTERGHGEVIDNVGASFPDSCDANATLSGDDAAGPPPASASAAAIPDVGGNKKFGKMLAGRDRCRSRGLEGTDSGIGGTQPETYAPPRPQEQESNGGCLLDVVDVDDDEAPQPSYGAMCEPKDDVAGVSDTDEQEDGGMGGVDNDLGSHSESWDHRQGGYKGGVSGIGVDMGDDSDYEPRGSEQHDSDVCSEEGDDYSDTEELLIAIDQLEEEEEPRMPLLPSIDALFSDKPPASAAAVPPVYNLAAAVAAAATATRRNVRISINSVHSELSDWDGEDSGGACEVKSGVWAWLEKLNELRRKACSCFVW